MQSSLTTTNFEFTNANWQCTLTVVIRRQLCSMAVVSTLSHLFDAKSWTRYVGSCRYFLYQTASNNQVVVVAKLSHDDKSWVKTCSLTMQAHECNQTPTTRHTCLMENLGLDRLAYVDIFYTRPRPILTRDLLIDSSMQIIHTYVNRLRGRMDDVRDMLF